MARVSRRGKSNRQDSACVIQINNTTAKIPTALYARLSSEQDDGDTIQNQLQYLREFVNRQDDLRIYDTYTDNGYTGTNFERPAFQRMMDDVQTGKVQCIIVKDLSRFGRNFVETGYYIERFLPRMNVRVVSINDNYDSSKVSCNDDFSIPIRNMVNDMYAKDISRKICASNEARRKSGNYTIEKSIYGYMIDKENNRFLINPETAPIVVLIFRWFLDGVKSSEIARRLNLLEIKTPNEYKYEKEFGRPLETKQYWDSGKVRSILKQEAYTGNRYLGMRRNRLYKNQHNQERVPREEWTVYENDHPALVSREDMQRVLDIIKEQKDTRKRGAERTEKYAQDREGMFSKLVYCKKCGKLMYHMNLKYPDGRIKPEGGTYECNGRLDVESRRGCRLKIKDGYLHTLVARQLRPLIMLAADKDQMVRNVQRLSDGRNPIYRFNTEISNLKSNISEYDGKLMRLYESLSYGLLEKDDYEEVKKRYHDEISGLKDKLEKYEAELSRTEKSFRTIHDLTSNLSSYIDDFRLTRELVDMLIERIDVDENHNIEIRFKCNDVFESLLSEHNTGDRK